jgi:hypothetical protein
LARRRGAAIMYEANKWEMTRPIRICLALLPDLARDILREIFAGNDDMDVVELRGERRAPADACDVLITRARASGVAEVVLPALILSPMPEMLVVTIDGAEVMMFEFRLRQRLIDPSPDSLIAAIRGEIAQIRDGARR